MECIFFKGEALTKKNEMMNEYIKPRLIEYDPDTISAFFVDRERQFKKFIKNKPILKRCEISGYIRYPLCSPVFLNELGFQIQRQLEEKICIYNIHEIPNIKIIMYPFYPFFWIYGFNYFDEEENGICYSYGQCMVRTWSKYDNYGNKRDAQFWIRFYSLKNPSERVDTKLDVTSEDVRFEICDTVPKSFPKIEEWPNEALEEYNNYLKRFSTKYAADYEQNTFNPENGIIFLKERLQKIIAKNKKAEEREARRKEKIKKKIPVEYTEELYWPDVIYRLTLKEKVSEDTVDELKLVVTNYFDTLKGEEPEFLLVDKVDDNHCDITVDFGMCSEKAFKGVISALEKSGIDIEKIIIDG